MLPNYACCFSDNANVVDRVDAAIIREEVIRNDSREALPNLLLALDQRRPNIIHGESSPQWVSDDSQVEQKNLRRLSVG